MLKSTLLLALILAGGPTEVTNEQIWEVTDQIICRCACTVPVTDCRHEGCPFAGPTRRKVAARLAAGETPEAILASYVDEYGREILAAPTSEGLDLAAWIAPFAVLLLGAIGVVAIVRNLRRRSAAVSVSAPRDEPSQGLLDRVEDELREGV
jgi:cytochrome c-type biogenesis protein CcmH/NrfF